MELAVVEPRDFLVDGKMGMDVAQRIAGAPSMGDPNDRPGIELVALGPALPGALDHAARIHQHAVEVEQQRAAPKRRSRWGGHRPCHRRPPADLASDLQQHPAWVLRSGGNYGPPDL